MISTMRNGMSHSEAGRLGASASRWFTAKQHRAAVSLYEGSPKRCGRCSKVLSYDKRQNKFCSSSCAAKVNNIGKCRHGIPHGHRVCPVCGKVIATGNERFCSPECFQKHRQKIAFEKFEMAGLMDAKEDNSIRHFLRRYLLKTRGNKCEICGGESWMGKPIPLVVDHISGNPENHSPSNVRLICGNCNMQLPTFAGRNRGKGRFVRRMRDRAIKEKLGRW